MGTLSDLPQELIINIVAFLEPWSRNTTLVTSHQLREASEYFLYTDVELHSPSYEKLSSLTYSPVANVDRRMGKRMRYFLRTIGGRPQLGAMVRRIYVRQWADLPRTTRTDTSFNVAQEPAGSEETDVESAEIDVSVEGAEAKGSYDGKVLGVLLTRILHLLPNLILLEVRAKSVVLDALLGATGLFKLPCGVPEYMRSLGELSISAPLTVNHLVTVEKLATIPENLNHVLALPKLRRFTMSGLVIPEGEMLDVPPTFRLDHIEHLCPNNWVMSVELLDALIRSARRIRSFNCTRQRLSSNHPDPVITLNPPLLVSSLRLHTSFLTSLVIRDFICDPVDTLGSLQEFTGLRHVELSVDMLVGSTYKNTSYPVSNPLADLLPLSLVTLDLWLNRHGVTQMMGIAEFMAVTGVPNSWHKVRSGMSPSLERFTLHHPYGMDNPLGLQYFEDVSGTAFFSAGIILEPWSLGW